MDQMYAQIQSSADAALPPNATPDQRARSRAFQTKLIALMKTRLPLERIRTLTAKTYDEIYSEDEVAGILTFYESPIGQAALEKLPNVMTKVMGGIQSDLAALTPEIQKLAQETMDAK